MGGGGRQRDRPKPEFAGRRDGACINSEADCGQTARLSLSFQVECCSQCDSVSVSVSSSLSLLPTPFCLWAGTLVCADGRQRGQLLQWLLDKNEALCSLPDSAWKPRRRTRAKTLPKALDKGCAAF